MEYRPGEISRGWGALVAFLALCLGVGALGGAAAQSSLRDWYPALAKPPGTPPGDAFVPVWAALYLAMAVAAWLVWRRRVAPSRRAALSLFGIQLLLNLAWSALFFGLRAPGLALAGMAALLAAQTATAALFRTVHAGAAALMLPHLGWACYAAYWNAGIAALN